MEGLCWEGKLRKRKRAVEMGEGGGNGCGREVIVLLKVYHFRLLMPLVRLDFVARLGGGEGSASLESMESMDS